ncbi:hypothetical protein V8E54_014983 [Elaphomyces granulatus]|jgi:hypothetical protein
MSENDILEFNADLIDERLEDVLTAFEAHPAMQPPNIHPTMMYMFDFINNTHRKLQTIDLEKLRAGDAHTKDTATDILGRNRFAYILVKDHSGSLLTLTGVPPSCPVDYGEDITSKLEALAKI